MIRNAFVIFAALMMAAPPAQAIAPPDKVYEVDMTLLGCALCRKKIKEIFLTVENVKEVDFDLTAQRCIVTMKGDKVLTFAVAETAFKDSKYMVKGVVERKTPQSKPAPGRKT